MVTGDYLHVFNRGVAKLPTFLDESDYRRAFLGLDFYRYAEPPMKHSDILKLFPDTRILTLKSLDGEPQLVEVLAVALMPNHWHLLVHQLVDGGVSTYLRRWTNSYTRYFNTVHERVGPLFQGEFKAVAIRSDELLLHVSRYIHLNHVAAGIATTTTLSTIPWNSYASYVTNKPSFCQTKLILELAGGRDQYRQFVEDRVGYARELHLVKHLLHD
jgi:putative transposase